MFFSGGVFLFVHSSSTVASRPFGAFPGKWFYIHENNCTNGNISHRVTDTWVPQDMDSKLGWVRVLFWKPSTVLKVSTCSYNFWQIWQILGFCFQILDKFVRINLHLEKFWAILADERSVRVKPARRSSTWRATPHGARAHAWNIAMFSRCMSSPTFMLQVGPTCARPVATNGKWRRHT